MRILIVEDDFASRKCMMNIMSANGFCDGTVDGMEAVEAYMMALEDEQPYDLICLDVMMPVMDGYQVLNTIRNMEKQRGIEGDDRVKIIMMTALNEQKNVRKAFEMGCTVYCAKPVDLDKLINVLMKLKLIYYHRRRRNGRRF